MTTGALLCHDLELPVLEPKTDNVAALAALKAAAEESWLARGLFGYVVTRYDDVVAVLRDKRWQSAAGRLPELMGITDPEFLGRRRESILSAEGDTHVRLRRLVAPAFSPRSADRLRPFMREVMNGLVDAVAASGAPKTDWQLFSRWANDVLLVFDGNIKELLPTITKAQDELEAYVRELIAERRSKPADDLLTDLIAAEEAGDRLSNEELVMMVEAVIVGGTDTTRNQLGCAVGVFAEHPDQWALLAERPDLASRAVDESMRYLGAVRGTGRFASQDIELNGVLFPAGTFIAPALAVANRDESVWTDADRFDITREPTGQPHLTFGSGIHYCLGASLARAELQEALPLLARRLPDLRLDGPITWKPETAGIWGAAHMPITFSPGR